MRILCVSAQLPGHVDWGGYLNTAVALQERGHNVSWASGPAVERLIQARGIGFHALAETGWRWPPPAPVRPAAVPDPSQYQTLRQIRSLDQWLDVERVTAAVHQLRAVVADFKPDLILAEMFMSAAAIVAETSTIPFIVVGWPAPPARTKQGPDPATEAARQRLDALCARFAIHGRHWTETGPTALRSASLHVTFWSDRWFGTQAAPPTQHVGGVAVQAQSAPEPTADLPDDPQVLITLGTSFNHDPAFFIAAARAAVQLGAIPLVVLGQEPTAVRPLLARLPAQSRMHALLDLSAHLPNVAAAIHHGGAGSTHALVTHAVPQIVVPHAADQQRQARGVARTEVGFHMAPQQATVENLSRALALLLPDRSSYRKAAHRLQREFASLGGVERAADLIVQHGSS